MKYVKMLGLLAVAAAALMAFAGNAAATVVTSPPGTVYTGTITATSEGYVTLHNAVGTISCHSHVTGSVQRHTGSGVITASGAITALSFSGCTNGEVHQVNGVVVKPGELEIHKLANGNGTLTSKNAEVSITMFGFNCIYGTGAGLDIGEVTPGQHGTLDISASIPRVGGSFFCGATGNWTGKYKILTPTNIAFS
jgi:hypothetical protein